jgi:hypothetical protein
VDLEAGPSRFHFETRGLGESGLTRIEGEEFLRTECEGDAGMKQVHAAHAHGFRVRGTQLFGLAEGVGPRNRYMRQDAVREVGFNILEGGFPPGSVNLPRNTARRRALRSSWRCSGVNGSGSRKSRMNTRAFWESDCVR